MCPVLKRKSEQSTISTQLHKKRRFRQQERGLFVSYAQPVSLRAESAPSYIMDSAFIVDRATDTKRYM